MGDIVSTDMPDADISGIHSTDMTGADTPHDITINTSSHDYHDIYPHHTADGHPYLADAMEG